MHKIIISATALLMLVFFSLAAGAEKKVGVLMFSDDRRYGDAINGFVDKLAEAGFRSPQTKITFENAGASQVKAAALVRKLAAAKLDLIYTLGTSATVIAARDIQDVPVVFGVIYDPVEAGIAKGWKSSGNNTTGVSTMLPMSKVLDSLMKFAPVKRLGVLYTPGVKNSESVLRDLMEIQADYKLRVVPVPLNSKEDIVQVLPAVLHTADAVYITGSNIVNSQISMIVDMANKAKVVTVTHLEDMIEFGVLLGVCSNSYQLGRTAGEQAVRILKGAKPSSLAIETPKKLETVVNLVTARAGGFRVPPEYMLTVTRIIQ